VPGIFGAGGTGVNVNTGAVVESIDADFSAALRASAATRGTFLLNGSPTGVQRSNLDRRYLTRT
jgi:hypothetical protein